MTDYERRERELEKRMEQLRQRQRDVRARASQDARRARNHALIVMGSMLLEQFEGGDWKEVSFPELEKTLERNGRLIGSKTAEALPLAEAKRRLREFERERRQKKGGQPVDVKDGGSNEAA